MPCIIYLSIHTFLKIDLHFQKKHLISIITRLGRKNNRSIYNLQRDFEIERILIT